ncbi:TonB-dependent receptor [Altererythrobacter arenosus]|uniref:TonB-dependent receptor n=1 Tax=Altererythrobacter arenosus TaxID=3032592 RepID=A0ABY8FV16_9SPHN|nr:TonB-dependent receptor [Altererythrobacter sp. CAU 1644]WFL77778.1 TonB-dependent receptor [Altererythrobacter sp. CAU 1644]
MKLRAFPYTMASVSALALLATAAPAWAQDDSEAEAAEAQEGGFGQIIVTANRRAEDVQDVAIAVTALNEELIEQKFSRDLLDLGSIAPNLVVDPILGNGTAAISIRGIQLNDVEKSFDPPVGVFLDGVYLASTTGALLNVFDAETIEVLRGPQGTLFGRNTIGGLMHVRRNRPTGEMGGKLSVTYGRFDQFDIKGVLNLPSFANGAIKAKVAAVRLDGGGYFKNITRGVDEGDNDLLMISPMVEFELGNRGELTLVYDYIRDRTPTRPVTSLTDVNQLFGFPPGSPGLGAPASDASFHRRTTTSLEQDARLDTHSITANGRYEFADGHEFHAVFNYRDTDENAIQEFDAVAATLFNTIRPQQIDQLSAELRYHGDLGAAQLVAGLYYFESDYNINQQTFFFGGEVGGTDYQQSAKSYAAFAQLDWEILDGLTLTLGGRYLVDKKSACGGLGQGPRNNRTFLVSYGDCSAERRADPSFDNAIPGGGTATGRETWKKFTPKIGLSYDFGDQLIYASYSEGFRSGGFNGRGNNILTLGPYNPETVENWEVGFKSEWLDNRLIVNGAYFNTKYKDKQEDVVFPDPRGATVTIVQNAAAASLSGFELETRIMPTDGLTFGLSVGHLSASYDEWFDQAPLLAGPNAGDLALIDKSDFELRRSPDWTVQADVNYEYVLGNGDSLVFAADYALKDDYYIVANTINTHTALPGGSNPGLIDSFGLLNGSVSYKAENFKVSIFGRNLTGADYFQHVLDVGTTFGVLPGSTEPIPTFALWSFGTINAPTTYGAEVTIEF